MKKKTKIIIGVIITILLLIIALLIFLLCRDKNYKVSIKIDGTDKVTDVVIKDGGILELPEDPKREGYIFAGWINQDNKMVTSDIKIEKDTELKAVWIEETKEIYTVSFDTGNDVDYKSILVENGKYLILPIEPFKKGYIFVGWLNEDGNFITDKYIITGDIKLTAKWIKDDAKTITITFNTDDDSNKIIIENGKTIIFPITPTKEGYVFDGWVNEKGEKIEVDSILKKDTILKATWKELYTCPSDCTVSEDKKTCSKTSTADLIVNNGCPSGTETVEYFCSSHKRKVSVGFDEDQAWIDAGILCDGNPKNFCVDYNGRYTNNVDNCPAGYFKFTYSQSGLDAEYGCAKKYDKGETSCPSGYTQNENSCTKTETISCTINVAKEYKAK